MRWGLTTAEAVGHACKGKTAAAQSVIVSIAERDSDLFAEAVGNLISRGVRVNAKHVKDEIGRLRSDSNQIGCEHCDGSGMVTGPEHSTGKGRTYSTAMRCSCNPP